MQRIFSTLHFPLLIDVVSLLHPFGEVGNRGGNNGVSKEMEDGVAVVYEW